MIKLELNRFNEKIGFDFTATGADTVSKDVDKMATSLDKLAQSTLDTSKPLRSMSKQLRGETSEAIKIIESQITQLEKKGGSSSFINKANTAISKFNLFEGRDKRKNKQSDINREIGFKGQMVGLGLSGISELQKAIKPTDVSRILDYSSITSPADYFSSLSKVIPTANKDLKTIASTANVVKNDFKSMADVSTDSLPKAAKNTNELDVAWGKFSKSLTGTLVRFRIISSAIKSLGSTVISFIDKAASYEEALNLYTMALGEFSTEGRKWADTITNALYLDPTEVLQYTGALYNLVEGLGVTSDYAYKMGTNLTQLAYDMSSYLNIDVGSAYEKLRSAMSGQSRAVASVGVALTQASLQELAYSMGIEKSILKMTQAEKTYLRYIQIMNQTKKMQGDLGRTIVTPENALRLLKTQFELAGKAIGNIFIPILLKLTPYLMALTNILNNIASKIAKFFGYIGPQEIDYGDALKNTSNGFDKVATSAGKAGKSVSRTLAAFDELNVVESKSSGGAGAGIGGDSIVDQLKDYITGYDMLKDLTADFETKAKSAEKTVSGLLKVLGSLFAGLAIGKLIKFVMGLNDTSTVGGALLSVFKKLGTNIKGVLIPAFKALQTGAIKGFASALQSGLGAIGTFVSVLGSIAIAATSTFDAFKNIATGATTLNDKLGGLIATLGIAATAAGLLAGPWGLVGVAIASIAGGVLGYQNGLRELQKQEEEQRRYDDLFDGQGASLGRLNAELSSIFKPIEEHNTKTIELTSAVKSANEELDIAKQRVYDLNATIESGDYAGNSEKIGEIKTAYSMLKDAVISADKAEKNRQLAQISNLYEEGRISKETYEAEKADIIALTNLRAAQANGYYKELADLEAKLATNKISQDDYNKEVEKLASKYSLVSTSSNDLKLNMEALYEVAKDGFDLENPEKMKNEIGYLQDEYKSLMDETTAAYDAEHEANEKWIRDNKLKLAMMDETDEGYKLLSKNINDRINDDLLLTESYNENMSLIGGTFKDVMATFLAQIDEAGKTTDSDMKEVVSSIEGSLDELKDYDMSASAIGIFDSFAVGMEKAFSPQAISKFNKYGVSSASEVVKGVNEEIVKSQKTLGDIGTNITKGVGDGLLTNEAKKYSEEKIKGMSDSMKMEIRGYCKIGSPAKLFNEEGMYIAEGVADGLLQAGDYTSKQVSTFVDSLQKQFDRQALKLNIDTGIESSFNTMLSKLQTFCDNWRSAVNSLVKNTKSTMNGISINNDGKVSYTSMPKINVKKFEDGGMPKSGDFFFANENGRAEFISSIGNRTAVANQDQMVQALTNAILVGMSRIQTNDNRGDITVYVGNDKVYKGQGEYQNRQSDRYGTTRTIKV